MVKEEAKRISLTHQLADDVELVVSEQPGNTVIRVLRIEDEKLLPALFEAITERPAVIDEVPPRPHGHVLPEQLAVVVVAGRTVEGNGQMRENMSGMSIGHVRLIVDDISGMHDKPRHW